ncbi:MAG TPA: sulfotransferase domain-containing protein [Nocardioidaceae bacterium]|nr:sulfotransferase domain-containing protein [Nocardioidaceae bacterium]
MTDPGDRLGAGQPDFVVIGAQKSASTFLQDQLAQHPQVEIAEGEVRAFEDPFYSPEAVASLPRLFSGDASVTARGIKRPDYLGRPEVAQRLRRHLPDARLFAVLREPVARAVSAYYHHVRHGFVPLMPLDDAFEALLAGRLVADYPRSAEILDYGRYGAHLRRYLDLFPRDRLMVFEQKSLTADPAGSLRRAFEFLDVDPTFTPTTTSLVSNRGVYAPVRLRLLRTKNRFVYDYTPTLDRRRPRRPSPFGWAYNASVVAVDRLVLSRFDSGRPAELSRPVRARVSAYYDGDRALLADLVVDMPAADAAWL